MTLEDLLSENQDLKNRVKEYARYSEQLEDMVRLLRMKKYAPSSEKLPEEEQFVFNEFELTASQAGPEDESDQGEFIEVSAYKKKKPKRKPLSKDLPREVLVIDIPEDQKVCPDDGTTLKVIGHESSERLDVIPMQVKVIETQRLTYACPCCQSHMRTAAVVPQVVPKGLPTSGTLAFIATAKFCDGLSLYQTEKIFQRSGVEVSRGSMAHWMIRSAQMAQPLLNLLDEDLTASDYAQIDETPVQVLKEKGKKPETKSYMWVRAKPYDKPIVIFEYDPTRSGKVATRLMEDFKGRLQCDGFGGYNELEGRADVIRIGCWAHGRRRFYEAVKSSKGAHIAKRALKLIQRLYRIEEGVRGRPPDEVFKIRNEKSISILADLRTLIDNSLHSVPPKSLTGKALQYLNNEWAYLTRYVEDGRVHIDNNFIENKIRPFALGRKRWLFSDTVDGARASASLYSLVETAKANGIEPYKYLSHIFDKLPLAKELCDYEVLLPWNVKI